MPRGLAASIKILGQPANVELVTLRFLDESYRQRGSPDGVGEVAAGRRCVLLRPGR